MHISSGTLFEIPFTVRIVQLLQQLEYHAFSFITALVCILQAWVLCYLFDLVWEVKPLHALACVVSPSPSLRKTTLVSFSPRSQLLSLLPKLDARKERGVLMIWIMQLSGWSVAGCLLPFLSFGPSQLGAGMTGIPA